MQLRLPHSARRGRGPSSAGRQAASFIRVYAWALVGFAALLGALTAGQALLEQTVARQPAVAVFPLLQSALRSLGAATSGSALLLSVVLWTHPSAARRAPRELRQALGWGLLATLPGFAAAAMTAATVGALVLTAGGSSASLAFTASDVSAGALLALIDAGLISFFTARFLPRLLASGMSLPAKLALVLAVSVALRATLGLLAGSVLSS